VDFGISCGGIAAGVTVDYWEEVGQWQKWGRRVNGIRTTCAAWVLWGELCEVVDCVVNRYPKIFEDAVFSDFLDGNNSSHCCERSLEGACGQFLALPVAVDLQ